MIAVKSFVSMDDREIDELQRVIADYPKNAEKTINDVLHGYGYDEIDKNIRRIMPVSGRTWKKKKKSAKTGNSLQGVESNLAITVKSRKNYSYLYFPDDGSNTRRHRGGQHFMYRGAEASKKKIIERCIAEIIK